MSRPWEMFHGTCSMCDSRATDCMCCDTCLATDPVGRDRGFRPRKDNKFPATPQSPNLMEENFKVGALRDFEDAMELYLPILRFVESGAVASYEDLPPPLRHDLARAMRLLHKAADAGLPRAVQRLGFVYMNGEGLPRDVSIHERPSSMRSFRLPGRGRFPFFFYESFRTHCS